jgi:hypothetical protein
MQYGDLAPHHCKPYTLVHCTAPRPALPPPPSYRPQTRTQVLAVHPGMVMTDVVRTLPRWMQAAHRLIMGLILLTPTEGSWYVRITPTYT